MGFDGLPGDVETVEDLQMSAVQGDFPLPAAPFFHRKTGRFGGGQESVLYEQSPGIVWKPFV